MLIINADDWGKDKKTTNNIDLCYRNQRISSTTAMMFMQDSERAATIALKNNYDVGLHLNFTVPFTANWIKKELMNCQMTLNKFFTFNKYTRVLYIPLINKQLRYSFAAQYNEFIRLYKKEPTHIDGHHHIHLCTNVIFNRLISKGTKIRRNLTSKNSSFITLTYRWLIDLRLAQQYQLTDFVYLIHCSYDKRHLLKAIQRSIKYNVELVVHPGRVDEYNFLMGDAFYELISNINKGSYKDLNSTFGVSL